MKEKLYAGISTLTVTAPRNCKPRKMTYRVLMIANKRLTSHALKAQEEKAWSEVIKELEERNPNIALSYNIETQLQEVIYLHYE